MKKIFALAIIGAVVTGCATAPKEAEYKYTDPNAFADYGPAMANSAEQPLGSYWQQENRAAIEAATSCDAIKAATESAEAADKLLSEVKGAYLSDPILLIKIGAITQAVMGGKCPEATSRRQLWVAALERAKENAIDDYRRTFFTQQLWWCK